MSYYVGGRPVLQFEDGTKAYRVEHPPGRPLWASSWPVFGIHEPGEQIRFYLSFSEEDGKVHLPLWLLDENGNSNDDSIAESFMRSKTLASKARTLIEASRVSAWGKDIDSSWLVRGALRARRFVPDDWLEIVDDEPVENERPIETVQRILPTFRLFSWYDPVAERDRYWPEDLPQMIVDTRQGTLSSTCGPRTPTLAPDWGVKRFEYDMVPRHDLPVRFIRIATDGTTWSIRLSKADGSATVDRRFVDLPLGWKSLASVASYFLHDVLQIWPESDRGKIPEPPILGYDFLIPTAEEVCLYEALGEDLPMLWPWERLEAWRSSL